MAKMMLYISTKMFWKASPALQLKVSTEGTTRLLPVYLRDLWISILQTYQKCFGPWATKTFINKIWRT